MVDVELRDVESKGDNKLLQGTVVANALVHSR